MSHFADYDPRPRNALRHGAPDDLLIRPATPEHVSEMAEITAEREGKPERVHEIELSLRKFMSRDRTLTLVTLTLVTTRTSGSLARSLGIEQEPEHAHHVVAFAKASYFVPPADAPANAVPEGWYLGGIIVRPSFRRRGIGSELTRARLAWIAERGAAAYYLVNVGNLASIDLHAAHGFEAVTTDIWFPEVQFTGGVGMLFRCDLDRRTASP